MAPSVRRLPSARKLAFFAGLLVVVGLFAITARDPHKPSASPGLASLVVAADGAVAESPATAYARACSVFCQGPLLHAVQSAKLFNDSKTFVDMPLRRDPEEVLAAFSLLDRKSDPEALRLFVGNNFMQEGQELEPWTPPDFQENPRQLVAIRDARMRAWALGLNRLWKELSRRQDARVAAHPQRHSALVRRFGMVVPGGRFRETYYWDTYWVVRGLLVCGMAATARGVVENLLDDVRTFGFVPNGGRVYYLDRSQPPLLTEMVLQVHEAAPNMTWLASALPVLEREYRFWTDLARGHVVSLPPLAPGGAPARLQAYRSDEATPRPESYREDQATAADAEQRLGRRREEVFRELRTGAETGWDFSSRWLAAGVGAEGTAANDLASINASAVVPVDLNCILYRVELGLAKAHHLLGQWSGPSTASTAAAASYEDAASIRARAIKALLWKPRLGSFRDYRLDGAAGRGASSSVSSLSDFAAPLWAGLAGGGSSEDGGALVESLRRSGLLQPGGAATTALKTGQQWDAPNAWAPLQLMLIEGLESVGGRGAALAEAVSSAWLRNCYLTWQATGHMQEKYDAAVPGRSGGGGEYVPQIGFGWSNGAVLVLLARNRTPHEGPAPAWNHARS